MDAISATIETAIAQKQAEGGDASALTGLKMRMEGALSGAVETRSVHTAANQTVDALIGLPREALPNAKYDSLMSAYRMYEANPSDANAASVVAAGKQALDSMDIAQLEQSGVLTQVQARALTAVKAEIENIDSRNGVGDNGDIHVALLGKDELVVSDKSFLDASGKVDWNKHAPNGGYKTGTKIDRQSIMKDNIIDRYGNEFGRYASPLGTTYGQRSLPYVENQNAYHRYLVIKDITNVSIGEIAAAFNHNGGGIQYLLPSSIRNLVKNGYLKEIF